MFNKRSKSSDKKDNQAIIVAVIGASAIILSAVINGILPQSKLKTQYDELVKQYEQQLVAYNNLKLQADLRENSEEELLLKAEKLYDQENYIAALQVYESEWLSNNHIALNNAAYIYINHFDENYIQKAKNCLEKAKAMDEQYESQFLAINVLYPESYEKIFNLLRMGIRNDNLFAKQFTYACLEEANLHQSVSVEDFSHFTYEEAYDVLINATTENEFKYYQHSVPKYIHNDDFTKIIRSDLDYVQIGTKSYNDTLHIDKVYANVRCVIVKRSHFVNTYIAKNIISFIYSSNESPVVSDQ